MRHNKEITALAQKWANKLAADGRLSHSNASYKGKELGENVASKWSSVGADYTGIYRKLSICGFSSVLIIEVYLDLSLIEQICLLLQVTGLLNNGTVKVKSTTLDHQDLSKVFRT